MFNRTSSMDNVDHFWLSMDEPTNLMLIAGVLEFDEPLDYDGLCSLVKERILPYRQFRQKIVQPLGGWRMPRWQDDELFDIRSHVHRVALPSPGDQKALRTLVGDLAVTPLDLSKPLWQIHLIENLGTGCALLFRLHHCIGDGISLIHLLLSTAETVPGVAPPGLKPADEVRGRFGLPAVGRMLQSGQERVSQGLKAVTDGGGVVRALKSAGRSSLDTAVTFPRLTLMPPDPKTIFKGRLGVHKALAWTPEIPLDEVKAICRDSNATINDVLMATVTGGLRAYLMKRQEPVNEREFRVTIPVNVRTPGTEWRLGNRFSLVYLSLPIHLEDPVLRLQEVKRRMDNLKKSPDALVGYRMITALGMLPSPLAKKLSNFYSRKATAVLTNVPGPRHPIYYVGKEIKRLIFWVPRTGDVSMGISIGSYNGSATINLAGDAGMVPDPDVLAGEFEKEFYRLQKVLKERHTACMLVLNDGFLERQKADRRRRKIAPPEHTDLLISEETVVQDAPCEIVAE